MLATQGIILEKELCELKGALLAAGKLAEKGKFRLDGFEDVHSAIEAFLSKKTPAALKLHSGRSRNDMVACGTLMYLKDKAVMFIERIQKAVHILQKLSKRYSVVPMPGFSHHRSAMPFTYGRWLDAYAKALERDMQSFNGFIELYDRCPLGACAGFGTTFDIKPEITAKRLGFAAPVSNSLDAVQQRWEAEAHMCFCLAKMMNHLSQLSESLIVLSMDGLELVKLPEEYCTGSSVMPHKKNPDVLEVTKAKASVAAASLQQLVDAGKNSFTGYNRDSQWTKKTVFHAIEECAKAPEMVALVLEKTVPDVKRMMVMSKQADRTTEAEQLSIKTGIPFREAKKVIEKKIRAEMS